MPMPARPRPLPFIVGLGVVLSAACADQAPTDPATVGATALSEAPAALVQEVRTLAAGRGIGPLVRPAPVRP